jgi:hypothetical protein
VGVRAFEPAFLENFDASELKIKDMIGDTCTEKVLIS